MQQLLAQATLLPKEQICSTKVVSAAWGAPLLSEGLAKLSSFKLVAEPPLQD